jgi:hypothetical protein
MKAEIISGGRGRFKAASNTRKKREHQDIHFTGDSNSSAGSRKGSQKGSKKGL